MKRKLLATFLMMFAVLALITGSALAAGEVVASGSCGENVNYSLTKKSDDPYSNDYTLTISGTGAMTDYPDFDQSPWYNYSRRIDEVIIEENVTAIGNYSFFSFLNLSNITIPNTVTRIGDSAFWECQKLQNIDLPSGLTDIGIMAFKNSGLVSISIPNSMTKIGICALSGCSSLESIVIPNSIIAIGENALSGCSSLKNITIPDSVTSIGAAAFADCSSLTDITIPNGVIVIERSLFYNCDGLTEINIPEGVLQCDLGAFYECDNLDKIIIPASVVRIEYTSFSFGANKTSAGFVVDPNNTEYSSQDGVLYNKEKTRLIVCPSGKQSLIIPDSVTDIEDRAFVYCQKLSSITFPENLRTIGRTAFWCCTSLTEIVIPGSVNSIRSCSFQDCTSLKKVTIQSGTTEIESYAFYRCSELENISIPSSMISIGKEAFAYCINLKNITYSGTAEQWSTIYIVEGNQELGLATLIFNGTDNPPIIPDEPSIPSEPTQPGTLNLRVSDGGLGKRVETDVTAGNWVTIQVRRAGSISITSFQSPPAVGWYTIVFSAPQGSTIQVWETKEEMTFTNGVPNNKILSTASRSL